MCLLRLGASRERLSIYQDSTSVGRYLGVVDTGSSTTCRILPGGQVAKEQQASRSQSHATNIPTHQPTPLSHPRSQAASTPNECRADDCARARAHTRRTTPPTPKSIIIILIIGVFGSPCLDPGDTTNVAMERHKDARQTRSGIGFPIPRASRKRVRLPPGVAHTHTHTYTHPLMYCTIHRAAQSHSASNTSAGKGSQARPRKRRGCGCRRAQSTMQRGRRRSR